MAKEKIIATVVINRAADMTKRGRKAVAAWFMQQAIHLTEQGEDYSDIYTARYLAVEE